LAAQASSPVHQSTPISPHPVQAEHEVVTPSQVTCPGSLGQLPFTAEQVEPLQLTVPPFAQFAVHMDL